MRLSLTATEKIFACPDQLVSLGPIIQGMECPMGLHILDQIFMDWIATVAVNRLQFDRPLARVLISRRKQQVDWKYNQPSQFNAVSGTSSAHNKW